MGDAFSLARPSARFKRFLALIPALLSFRIHPFSKCGIAVKTVCEQLISLRQWVAGIGVQRAEQRLGNDLRNMICRKPRHNVFVDSPVCGTVLPGHNVLVEW